MRRVLSVVALLGMVEAGWAADAHLRAPKGFVDAVHQSAQAMPFYMAVPMALGEFRAPAGSVVLKRGEQVVPAVARVAAYWRDGSAQWLAVDGVWPTGLGEFSPTALESGALPEVRGADFKVEARGGGVAVINGQGAQMALLTPSAKVLRITRPKAPVSDKPEDLDAVVQYAWAEDFGALSPDGKPELLPMRVREVVVETSNPVFSVYRVRGDGGPAEPGSLLEWQLRVRTYAAAQVVTVQMSWFLHWDPERFALASAKWIADFGEPFWEVRCAATKAVYKGDEGVVMRADAPGRVRVEPAGGQPVLFENPGPEQCVWMMGRAREWLSLALPNFTRLGPNHLRVQGGRVELAAWSDESGKALDCRRTVTPNEFGMDEEDFGVDARGLGKTVNATFCWAGSEASARAMATVAARRDNLWFPSCADLVRSQALGAWTEEGYQKNTQYLTGLAAQVNWVMASRDHWRWNGFVNFGDIRTNFHTKDDPAKGLHAMRWSLGGRYGWRQGAGDAPKGFLQLGLFVEDRNMILSAYDYASHVADVDVIHGRFGQRLIGRQGAMHRRNKNHWSGNAQTQYTPSRGMYLFSWLTGNERFAETLAEIRNWSARSSEGSIYSPSAWLDRYNETHNRADLDQAEKLLGRVADSWRNTLRNKPEYAKLRGIAVMYGGNFRRTLDCYPVLIEFHRATGDRKYLDAMVESVAAHPKQKADAYDLTQHNVIAYLLSNGIAEDKLGAEMVASFRAALARYKYGPTIPRAKWSYETLTRNRRYTYQTAELGWRAAYAPSVVTFFETGDGAGGEGK